VLVVGLAAGIAALAWRTRSLSARGAVTAAVVGTTALMAGWSWGGFLIGWFALASSASRLGRRTKQARTAGMLDKGANRDAWQVIANGGVYTAAAATALLAEGYAPAAALWGSAALAAAGADTLATEIGTWCGGTPRSVRHWQPVPPGSSGAVSAAGSLAMLSGALVLSAAAVWSGLVPRADGWIVAAAATAGAVTDTVLGALVQQRRWCRPCGQPTEQRYHTCGAETEHRGGWGWLANDQVNFVCTLSAALIAVWLDAATA
jgi:uncharacterized protein (TIGR00297 family)